MSDFKPKEPLLAVMFSLMFSGLGQLYAGRIKRGILFFSVRILIALSFLPYFLYMFRYIVNPNTELRFFPLAFFLIFPLVCLGFIVFVIFDAYQCAKIYNIKNNLRRSITVGKRILLITGIIIFGFLFNPSKIIEDKIIGNDIISYFKSIKTHVQTFKISSKAMEPTLLQGDMILVDKSIYRKSEPRRSDLIVFIYPEDTKKMFVKRLVGLPGETIEIKNGSILINGIVLNEPTFANKHYLNRGDYAKEDQVVNIPADSYFVLGDNSASSKDSRYWGFVPKKYLIGKAYKIYYPFSRSGPIK